MSWCLKFKEQKFTEVFLDLAVAHTKESAKALMNSIRMTYPAARLGFVVAMASDKDHVGFAREILSGKSLISFLKYYVKLASLSSWGTSTVKVDSFTYQKTYHLDDRVRASHMKQLIWFHTANSVVHVLMSIVFIFPFSGDKLPEV